VHKQMDAFLVDGIRGGKTRGWMPLNSKSLNVMMLQLFRILEKS
jgi:hypothetical protein